MQWVGGLGAACGGGGWGIPPRPTAERGAYRGGGGARSAPRPPTRPPDENKSVSVARSTVLHEVPTIRELCVRGLERR